MTKIKKKKNLFLGFIFLGILILPVFAFAENCPSMTTVTGTEVNFVGELTDLGGDSFSSVWFEYGKGSNYDRQTIEKNLTQPGVYCINVSDLSPCTTYYYRAAARNSAGTSYGETKTFTTRCGSSYVTTSQAQPTEIPSQPTGVLTINKLVRNLSDGTSWLDSVQAEPDEVLSFQIQVKNNGSSLIKDIIIKDSLPSKINFSGELKIDDISVTGDLISGLKLGNLSPNQTRTISFKAEVVGSDKFSYGETQLINTATAFFQNSSVSDSVKVMVQKKGVLGATSVNTGWTNNFFTDSFLLPLIISLLIVFIFKNHLIKWEEWLDKRKKEFKDYQAKKILQIKINKIKLKEFLKQNF